jgi:hypothetical protein
MCLGHDPYNYGYRGPKDGCPTTGIPDAIHVYVQSGVNIVVDVILMAMPIKVIMKSSLHWKAKGSGLLVLGLATA